MARILVVGNVTLDIVNLVETYPHEDGEVRALSQAHRRGGNGANSAVVLSQLGHTVHFAGTLASEPDTKFILDDFARFRVELSAVQTLNGGKVPTSYVTLSRATGSRTIVHVRDLPEYEASHFEKIDLRQFDWIHFEGRNLNQVRAMMERAREMESAFVSLEAEKARDGLDTLFHLTDLLLFSRRYAHHHGFNDAAAFLSHIHQRQPQARLACGWGEEGAYAMGVDGQPLYTPAFVPPQVVDTLGAGDAFNAGMIDGGVRGLALGQALRSAARVAGRKCGQEGFAGLAIESPTATDS